MSMTFAFIPISRCWSRQLPEGSRLSPFSEFQARNPVSYGQYATTTTTTAHNRIRTMAALSLIKLEVVNLTSAIGL